jgi:hypothetical protein
MKFDGVVKTLHVVRFTPEGSTLGVQFFAYPSKIKVFTNLPSLPAAEILPRKG